MEIEIIIAVFFVGFFSSFVGSLAGAGGGVISIPMLIFLGLPPQISIATKRFSSLGSEVVNIFQYERANKIAWRHAIIISLFTAVATIVGANILVEINKDLLVKILSFFVVLSVPFTFVKKDYGLRKNGTTRRKNFLGYTCYFFVDLIDTFVGAAGGYFTSLILISLMGMTYLEANATKKVPALVMAIVGTGMFAYHGIIDYSWGIALMFGMTFGGYLGAKTALSNGSYLVKVVFSVIVILSAIKLIFF